jgi:hypothetical protein
MNLFKKCFLAAMVMVAMSSYGQITVNACNPLFDNQDFVFANLGPDATGRNVFETIPITGDQPCSGVGVCELKIYWNDAMSRWELIADDGDANFNTNFLIYFNNETSTPNPPSLILGNWIENTAITGGTCGGDGAASINTMTGDIQDTTLSVEVIGQVDAIELYPNPTNGIFNLTGISNLDVDVKIFSVTGKLVLNEKPLNDKVDVSSLSKGIYFVEIKWNNQSILKKLIKK